MILSWDTLKSLWETGERPLILSSAGDVEWGSFASTVSALNRRLCKDESPDWGLYTEDPGAFLVGCWALLSAGKRIHLYHVPPGEDCSLPLLTDLPGRSRWSLDCIPASDEREPECREGGGFVLYTSGSTGEPKQIPKELWQIEAELFNLAEVWEGSYRDAVCHTTVSHQHFYGLLFAALLPLCTGASVAAARIVYPEAFAELEDGRQVLVASPAFLKRMKQMPAGMADRQGPLRVFSSGGFLPEVTAGECFGYFGTGITEIYGSTETGGIAWKISPEQKHWSPFRGIAISEDERFILESPYLGEDYPLDDALEIHKDGRFTLIGRIDSVVKVEDKRVALNELEGRLMETGLVSDAAVLRLEDRRQYTAAAVELSEQGKKAFAALPKREINARLREALAPFFHPTVLPRKWRYLDRLPRNSMAKLRKDDIRALFEPAGRGSEPVLRDRPLIHSRELEGDRIVSTLSFPAGYRYFDGHFPELKILPALAQVEWVVREATEVWDRTIPVTRIPRMKLKNPIFPDSRVDLTIRLLKEKGQIHFEYKNPEGLLLSGGKIFLEDSDV
jgi:hypothetical protein